MGYREELELKTLAELLRKGAGEKAAYEGDDEASLADKKIFGMREMGDTVDGLITDLQDEYNTLAQSGNVVHPYLTTKSTSDLMEELKNRLTGISEGKEYLVNLVRELTNKDEEERQKMEAAAKAQKEQLDNTLEQVKQVSEATTESVQDAVDQTKKLQKISKDIFGVDYDTEPNDKEPVSPQDQQTMQQVSPDTAQATPPVEQPMMPPAGGPATAPDMGAGAPPAPDAGAGAPLASASSPDMGAGTPPSPDAGVGAPPPPAGGDSGMFTPSQGMLNAISSPFGA